MAGLQAAEHRNSAAGLGNPARGRKRRGKAAPSTTIQGEAALATNTTQASDKYEVTARGDLHKLHGKAIGLPGVLFLTVTGAAPISAMLFNVPIGVGYGNG